jgi:lipase chaperone LimK
MRHEEDFTDYKQDLRTALRNAKELYVRYRSYYDALQQLEQDAGKAGYLDLDDLAQLGGEMRDLMNSDFFV